MPELNINTSQNVKIGYHLASIGDRVLATIIDLAFIYITSVLLLIIIGTTAEETLLLLGLPLMFYTLLCELLLGGQTIGKRLLKIKVIKKDGNAASFIDYLIRWMFRLVDLFMTFGGCALITIVMGEKGQRVGDILAHTVVIKLKKDVDIEDTVYEEVADNHQITFPEVKFLNDKDVMLIKKVRKQLMEIEDDVDAIMFGNEAKKKICDQTGISTTMKPLSFFSTIIKDYNSLYKERV